MLNINNVEDIPLMRQYYRTSDMLNLLEFFPEISPVRNLTIINSEKDFYDNIELLLYQNHKIRHHPAKLCHHTYQLFFLFHQIVQ